MNKKCFEKADSLCRIKQFQFTLESLVQIPTFKWTNQNPRSPIQPEVTFTLQRLR